MNIQGIAGAAKIDKSLDLSKVITFGPPIFAIVVAVGIAFFVVWPWFNQALTLRTTNLTLAQNAEVLEQKAERLASFDKDELRIQLSAAEQLIPSDKDIFTFIRQVEEKRDSSGVKITNLSVGSVGQFSSGVEQTADGAPPPPPPGEDVASAAGASEVQMKLAVSSDYRSALQFLNDLYSLPRVVIVKDVSFSQSEGQVTTSLTVNGLWQALPTELASIEAPLAELSEKDVDLLAKIETSGAVSAPTQVPVVPTGKNDIFTPFAR